MRKIVIEQANQLRDKIISHRRNLHKIPEIALDLPKTKKYLVAELEKLGYDLKFYGQSAISAFIGNKDKKVLMLRSDMDALPTRENRENPLYVDSENAHLCGHDIHMAQLLGAAEIFSNIKDKMDFAVKLIFQPAEEVGLGAKMMIDEGVMQNPKVDAAISFHVMPTQKNGTISIKRNIASTANDVFKYKIIGKGSHGSMPEKGNDPLLAASTIYQLVNTLVPKQASMFDNAVVSIGKLSSGDTANVLPETAYIEGTIRTYDKTLRNKLLDKLRRIVKHISLALELEFEEDILSIDSIKNDPKLLDLIKPAFQEVYGDENVIETDLAFTASEDFAYFSHLVPSVFALLGVGSEDNYPLHNPSVKFSEDYMHLASAAFVLAAMDFGENYET